MRRIRSRCARAASGQAAAPPLSLMNCRRRIAVHLNPGVALHPLPNVAHFEAGKLAGAPVGSGSGLVKTGGFKSLPGFGGIAGLPAHGRFRQLSAQQTDITGWAIR
jgi:hypothetical protein